MDIYEKIVSLLVASGNVSEEKVEQARKLAESLVWDGEVRPTQRAVDLATTLTQDEDWLNEKMCVKCGHSQSRHNTAGGFCKHCTCNMFVEPTATPSH